ncbi:MAG: anaerobic sulfatase maturase, partial [Candidatus Aminicenantes bacterium]|nr:anaerobic sulfatase maturase [Candidatus Aminicenantes bacterium]
KKSELFPETKIHRMSEGILEEVIRQFLAQPLRELSFSWQGGEPTLMGLPFFQKAVNLQQKFGRGQVVGNGLQTNGILIDKSWAKFLYTYKFLVGLSLDGPEHVHSKYRFLRNGKGSWSSVENSAKLLLDEGVAVNALSVVNDYSVRFPDEIYKYFKGIGLEYMQFIPCVETDFEDPSKLALFSVSADSYGTFLCRLFDLWLADFKEGKPTTSIRYFDSVFYIYAGLPPPECTILEECGNYVVVEHNGDVYSCDFFVEELWKLGNVLSGNLIEMLNSERQKVFGEKKKLLPKDCLDCPWLSHCRGGCTKDRIRAPKDEHLSHFCQAYKIFFQHADSRLQKLASDWKSEQAREYKSRQQEQLRERSGRCQKIGRNDPCSCGSGMKYKKCCGQ